jgi:hypothetical protein
MAAEVLRQQHRLQLPSARAQVVETAVRQQHRGEQRMLDDVDHLHPDLRHGAVVAVLLQQVAQHVEAVVLAPFHRPLQPPQPRAEVIRLADEHRLQRRFTGTPGQHVDARQAPRRVRFAQQRVLLPQRPRKPC